MAEEGKGNVIPFPKRPYYVELSSSPGQDPWLFLYELAGHAEVEWSDCTFAEMQFPFVNAMACNDLGEIRPDIDALLNSDSVCLRSVPDVS